MSLSTVNRILRNRILYAPQTLEPEQAGELCASSVSHVIDYTNNIVVFTTDDGKLFLKPAEIRLSGREFIHRCIESFFSSICRDDFLKAEITKSMQSAKCRSKFTGMGTKNGHSALNRYLTTDDATCIGLPAVDKEHSPTLRKFVFYAYGELSAYVENSGTKKGALQTVGVARALAVYKLSRELGINAVPSTRFAEFTCGGRKYTGMLTNEGHGINVGNVPPAERRRRVTPKLMRALSDISFLDALTCDNDRRPDNYFTVTDGRGDYVDICSFDNDGPTVFLPAPFTSVKSVVGCSPLIKRGRINRPHMNKSLAERILAYGAENANGYRGLLSGLQLACFKSRLKKLQKAIKKTAKRNPAFLLDDDGWTEECIAEELSGKYGKTYLVSFVTDCYRIGGAHPFDMSEFACGSSSFEQLADGCGYELGFVQPLIGQLPLGALAAIINSRTAVGRYRELRKWMKALKTAVPSLKFKLMLADRTPYMTDGGIIGISMRDLFRAERLVMAVAHESAHMLLGLSSGYADLKREKNSYEFIEYLADIVTFGILSECRKYADDGTERAIGLLMQSLGTEIAAYKERVRLCLRAAS